MDYRKLFSGFVGVVCFALLAACSIPKEPPDDPSATADIVRRITVAEAETMISETFGLEAFKYSSDPVERDFYNKLRVRRDLELQQFRDACRGWEPPELWYYRAYVTADKRGGSNGIVMIKEGKVVWHFLMTIYD